MAIRVSWRKHKQKDGEVILYGRFKIPVRTPDGKVEYRYTERSTHTGEKLKARQYVEAEYQKAYEEAHKPREGEVDSDTFAAAAITYMKNKGSQKSPVDGLIPASRLKVRANKRYLYPIIERIGTKKLSEIDQAVVDNLATDIYPGCTANQRVVSGRPTRRERLRRRLHDYRSPDRPSAGRIAQSHA